MGNPSNLPYICIKFDAPQIGTLTETDSSHLKIGRAPIGKDRIPTIHFQVFPLAVSFREG